MCILAGTLAVNAVRFHALVWVVALSLCYFGVKGGLFTLITGGHSHVFGPAHTMIYDNNTLADALVMVLPMLNYLRLHSEVRWVRTGIIVVIVLVVGSILGSYSREAYLALAVVGGAFWLRTKNKLIYPIVAVIIMVPLLKFMPDSFYQRAASIQQYSTDSSFQTRLNSWWVAYRYAMDHMPFGAGFYGMNLPAVWDKYIPGEMHAVHSVYFQTLGEQGVVGLALYLLVIAVTFVNLRAVRRNTKGISEFVWAYDLAGMMQLSVLAFCVGGAAAPINFFDLFFLWVLVSAALLEHTKKKREVVMRTAPTLYPPELQPEARLLEVPPR